MKINEAAKRLHTSAWTLRYYEQIDLIAPVTRISGMRDYDETTIAQIQKILDWRACGVTLDEIKQLAQLELQDDTGESQREILRNQAGVLRDQIAHLQGSLNRLETQIEHLPTKELTTSGLH